MARARHLANAPIREAIIDLRVKLPEGFKAENLKALKEKLASTYPHVKEERAFHGRFQIEAEHVSPSIEKYGMSGLIFRSQGGENVVQCRMDGFTFSRLKPYTSWEGIFPEAFRLWRIYVDTANPDFIARSAVRYINELRLPVPLSDFSEYLMSPPVIPPNLPTQVAGFLTRIVIPEPEFGAEAAITQAMERTADTNFVTVILDIDVYGTQQYGIDDEKTRLEFGELRKLKNQIFFNSITEKTAGLFE